MKCWQNKGGQQLNQDFKTRLIQITAASASHIKNETRCDMHWISFLFLQIKKESLASEWEGSATHLKGCYFDRQAQACKRSCSSFGSKIGFKLLFILEIVLSISSDDILRLIFSVKAIAEQIKKRSTLISVWTDSARSGATTAVKRLMTTSLLQMTS